MTDTGFVPTRTLAPQWVRDGDGVALFDPGPGSAWEQRPGFPDARGGLVSSATDLLRFADLLLGDGTTRDGVTLLDPEAVAAMTTDQLTAEQRGGPEASAFLGGRGWGYGMEVVTPEHGPVAGGRSVSGRRYGWAGGLGTLWYSYPEHDLAAVLITQVMPPSVGVFTAFEAALADEVEVGSPPQPGVIRP
jgi:CubicO group peptidase (beta-lactamase class C family)